VQRIGQQLARTGLGQVAKRKGLIDGIDRRAHVGVAGHQDADHARVDFTYAHQKVGAVHVRHAQVREHHRERALLLERAQTLLAALRRHDVELVPERARVHLEMIDVVIDVEHARLAGRSFRMRYCPHGVSSPECDLHVTQHARCMSRTERQCRGEYADLAHPSSVS
jgi:hypothetical protein